MLACLCVTPVHAQNSVTLYGIIDTAVEYANAGGKGTARLDSSSLIPSRWGLTGREDIGGGLQAIFKLEDGFQTTNGAIVGNGALFGREAWVGMAGPFGRVQVGTNYTPILSQYWRYSLGSLSAYAWGNAANNSVKYVAPEFGGLAFSALYSRGTNGSAGLPGSLGDMLDVDLNFKRGGFSAGVDYLQQRYASTAVITPAAPVAIGRYYVFGTSYDFGPVKAAALYQRHRGAGGVNASIFNAYAMPNSDLYEFSALIRHVIGGTLVLSFGQYKLEADGDGDSTSYGLREEYQLSKRTSVYAGAAAVRNHSAASFTVNGTAGPGIPVAAGKNVLSFISGMIHTF
jgi:predicted porin